VLSTDSEFKNVMKGIKYGAIDYLVKPVRLEELKLIWKHVVKNFLMKRRTLMNQDQWMSIFHFYQKNPKIL